MRLLNPVGFLAGVGGARGSLRGSRCGLPVPLLCPERVPGPSPGVRPACWRGAQCFPLGGRRCSARSCRPIHAPASGRRVAAEAQLVLVRRTRAGGEAGVRIDGRPAGSRRPGGHAGRVPHRARATALPTGAVPMTADRWRGRSTPTIPPNPSTPSDTARECSRSGCRGVPCRRAPGRLRSIRPAGYR